MTSRPTIILGRRDEPEKSKPRPHIDVNPTDHDTDAELERLMALGARPGESSHLPADQEGNGFCPLEARPDPLRPACCSYQFAGRRPRGPSQVTR